MRPLADQSFNARRDSLVARLDRLGRVTVRDRGARHALRKLEMTLDIPGLDDEVGPPDQVRFRYEEWWRMSPLGWVRVRYHYDSIGLIVGGLWGFHLHPLPNHGREPVPHRVCVQPDGTGAGRHFAAHEVDLLATHEVFEAHYVGDEPIDCRDLTPID